jgi:hypothetical protein
MGKQKGAVNRSSMMAPSARLEHATYCSASKRSNPLSYEGIGNLRLHSENTMKLGRQAAVIIAASVYTCKGLQCWGVAKQVCKEPYATEITESIERENSKSL